MGNSQISGIHIDATPKVIHLDIVKRQEEVSDVMFADMISMNASANAGELTPELADDAVSEMVQSEKTEYRRENASDAYEKYQYKDKSIRAENKAVTKQDVKEAVEELNEFSENVTEVIAEELHVSKEEIEAAMEQLGLSYLDLMDASNLANLVAKLSGSENVNQLLMSESFMNIFTQVNELGTELFTNLQMSAEELKVLIAENPESFENAMKQAQTAEQMISSEVASDEKIASEAADEMTSGAVSKAGNVEAAMTESADDTLQTAKQLEQQTEVEEGSIVVEDERLTTETSEQMNMTEEDMADEEANLKETVGESKTQASDVKGNEQTTFSNVQLNAVSNQNAVPEAVQTVSTYVNVSELLEQFAEQTRVTITAEITKMEMQLNPEHLGKLYLEISESEGAVTAKIQTQNTIVKEALEMQIADLRQSLNQAGVKVDAIEVTVASHEFEQNLEQNESSERRQEDAQSKTARHRNLNLSDLDSLSGLMTEEETLVAKMMAEQGNSIDFTA